MAIFRDISLSDKTLRQALVTAWQQNDMATVLQKLADAQAANKGVKAAVMNGITTALTTAQQAAETRYKTGRIKTSSTTPTGMTSGQVFFKEGGEEPSSVTITWDGDTTGKTEVDWYGVYSLYKVANSPNFSGYKMNVTVTLSDSTTYSAFIPPNSFSGNGIFYGENAQSDPSIIVADSDDFMVDGITIEEKGVYFMKYNNTYVSSVTLEQEDRSVYTWDGDTTSKPSIEYDDATYYKVDEAIVSASYPNSALSITKDPDLYPQTSFTQLSKADNVTGGQIYKTVTNYPYVFIATNTTMQFDGNTITFPSTGLYFYKDEGLYVPRFEIKTQQ